MNYVKISELPEISLQEISGSEDIILTKNTASKKLKLDTLYNYITNDINLEIETKVDKISGKGLSTEDFTTPEKSKLENIAENANNYSLPISSVSILGGIKKGDYLDISIDGIASISPEVPVKWGNIQSKPELYTKSETDDLFRNDSTNLNTPNLLVRRDSSGNFSASTITANLNGNANSANALGSPRTFAITGDVTGTVTSNLSNGFSINTSVQDDSHSHTISTLTGLQTLLDNKIETSLIGSINGVASLDAGGKVPSIQLPSYVDDVLEFADLSSFPETGEIGKIYVALDTNKTYRWSGSIYVYITSGGVDSVNGFTGIVNLSKSDIGLGNVDNTADINKNVLSASKLTNSKTFAITGDVTGTVTSNLSNGVSITSTLTTITDNGTGSFKKISTDSKGRVIGTTAVTQSDITTLLGSGSITNAMLVNTAVANLSGTNTGDQTNISGNAGTATKLQTARTINGVSFDGSADITITSDALISASEYSTRNIRNSKRVFGIEVDLGALPNTTFKEVAFSFNAAYTYWIDGQNSYSTDGSEVITIPYNGYIGDGVSVKLDRTNNKIIIIADKDRTSFSSTKLVLNYTK